MNSVAVECHGAIQSIQFRQSAENYKMSNRTGGNFRNCRATGNVDNRFICNNFPDALGILSGLGLAFGMPPNEAQLPVAMIAAAPDAASFNKSSAVRPPIVQ